MNYYERHIGHYLKDTAHLGLLEHGIYGRLLDVYYTRECGLALADAARLIGVRSKDERAALQSVLQEFFVLQDGVYTQARCERDIAKFQTKIARNREVGKLGGRPRKPTNNQTPVPNHQTPDTNNQTPLHANSSRWQDAGAPVPSVRPHAQRHWQQHPRAVGAASTVFFNSEHSKHHERRHPTLVKRFAEPVVLLVQELVGRAAIWLVRHVHRRPQFTPVGR